MVKFEVSRDPEMNRGDSLDSVPFTADGSQRRPKS